MDAGLVGVGHGGGADCRQNLLVQRRAVPRRLLAEPHRGRGHERQAEQPLHDLPHLAQRQAYVMAEVDAHRLRDWPDLALRQHFVGGTRDRASAVRAPCGMQRDPCHHGARHEDDVLLQALDRLAGRCEAVAAAVRAFVRRSDLNGSVHVRRNGPVPAGMPHRRAPPLLSLRSGHRGIRHIIFRHVCFEQLAPLGFHPRLQTRVLLLQFLYLPPQRIPLLGDGARARVRARPSLPPRLPLCLLPHHVYRSLLRSARHACADSRSSSVFTRW